MSKKKIALSVPLVILVILNIVFIFGNSIKVPTESFEQSETVYDKVFGFLSGIFGSDFINAVKSVITPWLFRKLAHVAEFFTLGILVNVLFAIDFNYKWFLVIIILAFGLFVASIDEFIQLFSSRASSFSDVLIDMSLYSFVSLLFFIVRLCINKKKINN